MTSLQVLTPFLMSLTMVAPFKCRTIVFVWLEHCIKYHHLISYCTCIKPVLRVLPIEMHALYKVDVSLVFFVIVIPNVSLGRIENTHDPTFKDTY